LLSQNFGTYRTPATVNVLFKDHYDNATSATVSVNVELTPSQSYQLSVLALKNGSAIEGNHGEMLFMSKGILLLLPRCYARFAPVVFKHFVVPNLFHRTQNYCEPLSFSQRFLDYREIRFDCFLA